MFFENQHSIILYNADFTIFVILKISIKTMKKHHSQKLVILSLGVFLFLNIPLVLIFNSEGHFYGIPTFYVSIFVIWSFSVGISYIIMNRYYE